MKHTANRVKRTAASGLATVMVITLAAVATGTAARAEEPDWPTGPRQDLRRDEPVPVTAVEPTGLDRPASPGDQVWEAAAVPVHLPRPGTAAVDFSRGEQVSSVTSGGAAGEELPVTLAAPSQHPALMPYGETTGTATVEVLDEVTAQAAGVAGVLVAVAGEGRGPVDLSADYSSFAGRFGGGWALRLRWVELPACAVTTPRVAGCLDPARVESSHWAGQQRVSSRLQLADFGPASATGGIRVFGLIAGESGDGAGDFSATDLSPAGSWAAGGNDGGFTYSYPLRLPPAAGPVPAVSLGYSSASHDGRTSGTNNQASWIGDGWGYEPGFIERSYQSCANDTDGGNNPDPTGDLCWDGDGANVTMSLNGSNATLVRDDGSGQWRAEADGNWRIELLGSPASPGSGTTERWRVTTPDGTRYFFASEVSTSNSRLTVPVFGNHSGEPCRASAFKDSSCRQAYRWLLDKVIDVHGNMSRYFYSRQTGHYGAAGDPSNRRAYHRAAVLQRIEYGLRADDASVAATGRVRFDTEHRCLSSCGSLSNPTTDNWPDTPWDLTCQSAPCTSQRSPAFFATARLAQITTQVRDGGSFRDVDSWKLEHRFQDYGDDEQRVLWLKSIQHTGHVGGEISLPKLEFTGEAMPNRVDGAPGVPVMWRWRMFAIKTETGAVITVGYRDPECTPSSLPSNPHNNSLRCFPVRWTPEFHSEPIQDWFHKHVVDAVIETDTTGGQVAVQTSYEYSTAGGGTTALWAFDDSEFTDDEHRTYGQWRGYPQVTTRVGDPAAGGQTRTRERFYRGMHGQPLPSGSTRSVSLTDAEGNTVVDHEALAGRVWEQLTYNGPTIIAGNTTRYWTDKTATRERNHDGGDLHAWMTGAEIERARVRLVGSTWQRTETRTTVDSHGRPVAVSSLGDTSKTGDEYCTRTEYADNQSAWILEAVARTEVVAVDCDTTPTRPNDLVSDTRTFYDGSTTHGSAPTRALPTRVDAVNDWDGGPVHVTTSRLAYDSLGRVVETEDALGSVSTLSYTPQGPGPVTRVTSTNPLGHHETRHEEPAWGVPTATVDPNGRRVDVEYDALGRTAAVWPEGRSPTNHPPSMQFTYLVRDDAPTAVVTETLNHARDYITSVVLYDALLRERQTQTDTADGGRLLTELIYDSHGRVEEERGPHYNDQAPGTSLVTVQVGEAARRTEYVYDGAGRLTEEIFFNRHVERWRTTTSYGGSSDGFLTAVQPPAGAPAEATVVDVSGNPVAKRTYESSVPTGAFSSISYGYSPTGQLESLIDEGGNVWSWEYDLRERLVAAVDPDAGTTVMTYDDTGNLLTVTNAAGEVLQNEYDPLGRVTARRDADGALLAQWEYDTAIGGVGMLGKATRWHDGEAYVQQTHAVSPAGKVAQESVTLPASLGPLGGQHWFTQNHYPNGQVAGQVFGGAGSLETGGLAWSYDHLDNPRRLIFHGSVSGVTVLVDEATYTPFNELQTRTLGANHVRQGWHGFVYEEDTRRLERATFDRQASIHSVADLRYEYDDAGNVLSIGDVPEALPANHELQCYRYDQRRRLIDAWAQDDPTGCAADPSMSVLGGPAPYWHTYDHDIVGNRTFETLRTPGLDPVERTYHYPAPGTPQPHTVQEVDTAGSAAPMSFTYDAVGNTVGRSVDGHEQTLVWDEEGNLNAVEDDVQTISMIYDADGQRLIRDDGETVTAFLPQTELVWDRATDTVDGTRYFNHHGQVVAVNTGPDVADWIWMGADHHGTTSTHAVNAFTGVDHVRRMDPYGNLRGEPPQVWAGQQGFVGGVEDPSGLVHIGARSYDPQLGRFISVDPILSVGDDQQINGYAYSNNNPVTWSDPTGMLYSGGFCIDECGSVVDRHYQKTIQEERTRQASSRSTGRPQQVEIGSPDRVNHTFDNGANLVIRHNGDVLINGYHVPIPEPGPYGSHPDPWDMARFVDEWLHTGRGPAGGPPAYSRPSGTGPVLPQDDPVEATRLLLVRMCEITYQCGLKFKQGVREAYPYASLNLCVVECISLHLADGSAYLTTTYDAGAPVRERIRPSTLRVGASYAFGFTSVPASEQAGPSHSQCAQLFAGACTSEGLTVAGDNWSGQGMVVGKGAGVSRSMVFGQCIVFC